MSKLHKSLLWPVFGTAFIFLLYETEWFSGHPLLDRARFGVLALWCLAFALRLVSPGSRRKFYGFDLVALLFIGLCFMSTYYSVDPDLTWQRSLSALLIYGAVFWCVWEYVDLAGAEKVTNTLLATAALFYGAGLLLILSPLGWLAGTGRFTGVFRNPNFLGLLSAIVLPLVLARILQYKRWFDIVLFLGVVLSLITSGSRAGILACSISTLFILYTARVGRIIVSLGIFIVFFQMLATLGAFDSGALEQFGFMRRLTAMGSLTSSSEVAVSSSGRLNAWGLALQLITTSPLSGHGFGTEASIFNTSSEGFDLGGLRGDSFFNSYLGLTVQVGVIGSALFFLALFFLFLRPHRKDGAGTREDLMLCALRGVVLSGLVTAAFESWIYSVGNGVSFIFWTCVMLLLRSSKVGVGRQRLRQKLRVVLLRELLRPHRTISTPVSSPKV